MRDLIRAILTVWFGIFYKVKVTGLEVFPAEGGAILCANHTHYKDLMLICYKLKRKVRWLAKAELFRFQPFASLITRLGAFPVNRGKSDRSAVKTIYELLGKGEVVGIFPEGTRVRGNSSKPEIKRGFVSFALKAKVPIYPVSIAFRSGPFRKCHMFSRIDVIFQQPVVLDFERDYGNEDLNAIANEIMENIYSVME